MSGSPTPRPDKGRPAEDVEGLLAQWTTTPSAGAPASELREAVADYARGTAAAHAVFPAGGPLWLKRRAARRPLAVSTRAFAAPGDTVLVPRGSFARLRCADGSEILLHEDSALGVLEPTESPAPSRSFRLEHGRAYARVVRLPSVRHFTLHTPCGDVEVLGTEFDVTVKPEENQLRVIVRRGSVAVQSGTTHTEKAPRRLESGDELTLSTGRVVQRRLDARELREELRWKRAAEHPLPRRRLGLMVLLAILLALLGVLLMVPRAPRQPDFAHAAAFQPVPGHTAPFPADRFFPPGESLTFTVHNRVWENERWHANTRLEMTFETAPDAPADATPVQVTFDDFARLTDPVLYLEDFEALRGWTFDYTADLSGDWRGAMANVGPPHQGAAAMKVFVAWNYAPAKLLPPRAIAPGESWDRRITGRIDGMPEAFYLVHSRIDFDGYVTSRGRLMAQFTEHKTGRLGGFLLRLREGATPTNYLMLQRDLTAQTTYYFDAHTGDLLGGLHDEHNSEVYLITEASTVPNALSIPHVPEQGNLRRVGAVFTVRRGAE